jgi:hypothetical protein
MSVKCLTVVLDDDGKEVCVLYSSTNGQLTGHGRDLKDLLRGYTITHDLRSKDRSRVACSMGHLTVILTKKIRPINGLLEMLAGRNVGEEYVYTLYPRHTSLKLPSLLNLRIEAASSLSSKDAAKIVIYDGLLDEFEPHAVEAEWSHPADLPKQETQAKRRAAKAAGPG